MCNVIDYVTNYIFFSCNSETVNTTIAYYNFEEIYPTLSTGYRPYFPILDIISKILYWSTMMPCAPDVHSHLCPEGVEGVWLVKLHTEVPL